MSGPASSFHRGEYRHMRRGLTQALIEAEAMEPRVQMAYSLGLVPAELVANMTLVRLLLERADRLTRRALDVALGEGREYHDVYAETRLSDELLATGGDSHSPRGVEGSVGDEELQRRLLDLGASR